MLLQLLLFLIFLHFFRFDIFLWSSPWLASWHIHLLRNLFSSLHCCVSFGCSFSQKSLLVFLSRSSSCWVPCWYPVVPRLLQVVRHSEMSSIVLPSIFFLFYRRRRIVFLSTNHFV